MRERTQMEILISRVSSLKPGNHHPCFHLLLHQPSSPTSVPLSNLLECSSDMSTYLHSLPGELQVASTHTGVPFIFHTAVCNSSEQTLSRWFSIVLRCSVNPLSEPMRPLWLESCFGLVCILPQHVPATQVSWRLLPVPRAVSAEAFVLAIPSSSVPCSSSCHD